MNILIYTAIYPAPAEYGIPNDTKVVHYYAKQWRDAGHTVQVVYLHMIPVKRISAGNLKKCGGFEADYVYDGIDVHLLEYQLLVPRVNYLSAAQARNAEKRIGKFLGGALTPDRVFVHFPCSFMGIKCLSDYACPTMAVLHNVDTHILRKHPKLSEELNRYKHLGGRNKKICETVSSLLSRESSLILSGIDESLIPPTEWIEEKAHRCAKPLRIVYAGNLIPLKKVDVILRALERVSFDYQCDIIGDGPEKNALMVMAEGNSRISFKGRLSREETVQGMRDADIFVMVSSPETFGLVYVEAMAQGCLTVGSKNEGIDGVIRDGINGFLVPPGNVEELAACLEKIAAMDKEQKQALVHAAYRDAADMTDRRMAEKYLSENYECVSDKDG